MWQNFWSSALYPLNLPLIQYNDGPHIELQYSSVGRTMDTNSLVNILESR